MLLTLCDSTWLGRHLALRWVSMWRTFTVLLRVAISKPRIARDGSALPSARLVSINIHLDVDVRDPILTHLHMVMGQFVDHDLSKTAISTIAASADGRSVSLRMLPVPHIRVSKHGRSYKQNKTNFCRNHKAITQISPQYTKTASNFAR